MLAVLMVAAAALPVSACGGSESGATLTVEGTLSLCPPSGKCTDLPAAGAEVRVFDEAGKEVGGALLDDRGHRQFRMPAGIYTATLSMPGLGIRTTLDTSPQVSLVGGGDARDLAIVLPPVSIAG